MSSGALQERRRFPRVAISAGTQFRLGRRLRVRVLDISASGALLASDEPLAMGAIGRLQVLLSGVPFETNIEVAREQPAPDGRGRLAGVVIETEPVHQTVLDDFLRRAGS